MANTELYAALRKLQNTYDEYFVSLADGDPEEIELPEITPEDVAEMVTERVPSELDISTEDLNGVMDAMKAGFTYIKLNKEGAKWATGLKLTSIVDFEEESGEPEEEGLSATYEGDE